MLFDGSVRGLLQKSLPISHVFSCPLTIKGVFEAKKDPLKERFIQILIFRASPLTIKGCFEQKRVGLSRNFPPLYYKGRKKGICGVTHAKTYSIFNIGQKRGDEQQRSVMVEPILLNQVKTI